MIISLERILTSDGLWLDGLFFKPQTKTNKAIIWVHGLLGNFYGGGERVRILGKICTENNFSFVSFNTRGAGVMSRFSKQTSANIKHKNRKTIGGGLENFKESIWDIEAMIKFLQRRGFKKIYLVGHSTGANKVLYYMYKRCDRYVAGISLVGPMNDFAGKKQELGSRYNSIIKKVKVLAKKNPHKLLPYLLSPVPTTAARYLSLYTPGTPEDVFPYYNKKAKFKELASVRAPILVLIGERDEYLDRSPQNFVNIFKSKAVKTKKFVGQIIKSADHGFYNKEKNLAEAIVNWIKKI
ncbi:MAG: alpha/beta fold hydrolase [Patescibacteria group bacterium]